MTVGEIAGLIAAVASPVPAQTWTPHVSPYAGYPGGAPAAIGFYSKGCVSGAVELPETGPTWQARVRGENLSLTGPEIEDTEAFAGSESEAEAWRVACAAWWAANPEQGARPNIQGIPGA